MIALLIKGGIFAYAHFSDTHNKQTRLYLLFLFALSIQNIAEVSGFYTLITHNIIPATQATTYYASSIVALAFIFHLALHLAFDEGDPKVKTVVWFVYGYGAILEILLFFTPWLISGYVIFPLGGVTRVAGPLFYDIRGLRDRYIHYRRWCSDLWFQVSGYISKTREKFNDVADHNSRGRAGNRGANAITSWNKVVQHTVNVTDRLYILLGGHGICHPSASSLRHQFYIPWSKVPGAQDRVLQPRPRDDRRDRGPWLGARSDTSAERDPGLLGGAGQHRQTGARRGWRRATDGVVPAGAVAQHQPHRGRQRNRRYFPRNLRHHAPTRRGAVVPFYPHSQSASGWMLLGDAFSEQVYTPLDFKMVEQLFDKMAELFLDKLLLMRSQLAAAERRLQTMEFRLQEAETGIATLRNENETLQQSNLRLTREQAADSLLATDMPRAGCCPASFARPGISRCSSGCGGFSAGGPVCGAGLPQFPAARTCPTC